MAILNRRPGKGVCRYGFAPVEAMEQRVLLSAGSHHPVVKGAASVSHVMVKKLFRPGINSTGKSGAIAVGGPRTSPLTSPAATGATGPFSPAQIRQFYGIGSISFNGITGDGTGQTIAVIDAYKDSKFVNSTSSSFSTSDLHVFDQRFGLPDPPSFSVIPESGHNSLPKTYNSGWAGETALDVEWSHSIAPQANIILVECASASDSDLITNGVAAARAAGASVISMSFGGSEATSYDSAFTQTTGNTNVTYLASTGDNGVAGTGYPSLSPYVVAVGGTSITTSDASANYGSEVVWNTSSSFNDGTGNDGAATGGGIASIETKPSYQAGETLSGSHRGVPDVSFEADPYTGVYVLDTSQAGGGGYYEFGGTSLSSPCWAGLIAIADQGRAINGQSPMNGFSTTLPRLYALPSSDFHDITSGNNTDTNYSSQAGYFAGVGYDLASGIGTPVANTLVTDLAGVATITGRVFVDNTGNGTYGGSDAALAGKTVYLDLNNDGVLDNSEPSTTTNAQGAYTFNDQPAGGAVRLSAPVISGYVALSPSSVAITYGTTDTINFTYFPLNFSTTTSATNYTLQTDAANINDQILVNGSLTYSVAKSVLSSSTLTFSLTGAGDSFTVNGASGNPIPAGPPGGITLTGASGGDALNVVGTASDDDSFLVTSSSIGFNSNPINFSHVSLLTLNPGTGTDSLVVNSGSVTIPVQTPGSGILTRNFSSLSVASGAAAIFATAPAHADRTLIETSAFSDSGELDLGGNDLIVHHGDLAPITALLTGGYNNGSWNGTGIASAAANADTTHRTALGIMANNFYGGSGQPQFDGTSPLTTDILIKYTYYGDTNLDGKVDGSDYSRIDNGYLFGLTGWENGDFNYDKHVDGSDYTLIDNAFNSQGTGL